MARTVADFITESLKAIGVKRVYGVVGDSLNGFTDALRRIGGIDWIHGRHDIRPEALGNRCPLELGLVGDVAETLRGLLPRLAEHTDSHHLDEAVAHYKKTRASLDELAESKPNSKIVHPQYLTRLINELAAADAIFTCDVGTPTAWAARYLQMNGKRRLLGSFNHGSMANALLQAIGAQATFPGRQVVSLSGDGGFTMMMGDFITLRQVGAGEGRRPQQRHARIRRAGDEGRRTSRHGM